MNSFNPEEYWGPREFKVWVVTLIKNERQGRKKVQRVDRKIVRARAEGGAIKTARYHSSLTGRMSCSARLATPFDLGVTECEVQQC